jgi:hypothetical protein
MVVCFDLHLESVATDLIVENCFNNSPTTQP